MEPEKRVAITINVMDNDLVPDPANISIVVSNPAKGSAVVLSDGSIRYTPANKFKNNDSFTYTLFDGYNSASATVTVKLATSGGGSDETHGGGKGGGKPKR